MAGRSAVLAVRIIADAKQARSEVEGFGRTADREGSRIGTKLKAGAGLALGGIALLGKSALDAASDLQQATGAAQSVFGKYANSVIKNAKGAADAVGLSQSQFLNQSVLLGSQLKNLGTPMDQVAGQTDNLIKKASDLAATFGGSTAEAVEAIGSLMRGERDPIERYGVSINQAAIDAYEAAHGLKNLTGAQKKNADAQATLAILAKQTAAATGQFRRETSSAAGATEIANAKFENAKAALGQRLLPIYARFKTILAAVAGWVTRNSTLVFTLVGAIGGLSLVVLASSRALRAYRAIQAVVAVLQGRQAAATGLQTLALGAQKVALGISTAAQWAFNAAMSANPIGLVVIAIAALAAGLILAWKKSETFRAIVTAAFDAVMNVVRPVVTFFTETLPGAFLAVGRGLRTAWNVAVAFLRTWGPRALYVLAPFIGIPILIARKFGAIVGFLRGVWSSVSGGVRNFVTSTVNAILSIPGRIARLASGMLRAGRDFIESFFRGIGNVASKIGNFASQFAHSVVNAIINGLNNMLDLPWKIKVHIPIPMAPDVNFGPWTVLPRIPTWSSVGPNVPGPPDVGSLLPGWSILAARFPSPGDGWTASIATPRASLSRQLAPVIKVYFNGLVTDPEGVAREIRTIARRSDERNGLTRGSN